MHSGPSSSPYILTPFAVSPERLKAVTHVMYFETNAAKDIQVASQAISSSKPVLDPSEGHIDAPWSVFLLEALDVEVRNRNK